MMMPSSLRLLSATGLLALTLLSGVYQSRAGTEASSGDLTLSSATPSTHTLGTSTALVTSIAQGNTFTPVGTPVGTITPGLFGNVNDLAFKNTKSGATRAKATVNLANTSSTTLRNVTATVYLSDDDTLSADDTKIVTLDLSDYVPKGKVPKHDSVNLPFNYKVPSIVASYLNGKYLIIVLSADNLGTLTTTPVVVGPITLP